LYVVPTCADVYDRAGTYLVRESHPSLVLFMLAQLYGGPCSPAQEPGPGGGQPNILFLWLKKIKGRGE